MTKKPECKDCKKREEKEKEEKKIKLKSGFGDEDNGDGKCVDVSHQVWKQIESNPLAFVSEMKRKYPPFSTLLLQNFIRNLTTDWRAIERLERLLIGHNQIDGQELEFATLKCIAACLPPLKQLTFRNCKIVGFDLDYMLQRLDCSKLEVFELASVEILGSQIDHAAFQKFLQRCKCLKQLTLCVTGAGSTPIIDIQLPKSMETIGITHAVQIDWNTLTSCDKLQSVKISNEKTPKIIGNMEDALIKGENMKKFELNVANQPITEQILAAVCAQHPKLKRLRGRFDPRINDWSPIAKLTKLQDLEIKMDSNYPSNLTILTVEMLQKMFETSRPPLKTLELTFDDVDENVLEYLAEMFGANLECFHIKIQCGKGQFRAESMKSFITSCSKLKQLHIVTAQKCDLVCLANGKSLETVTYGSNLKHFPVEYSMEELKQLAAERRNMLDFWEKIKNEKAKKDGKDDGEAKNEEKKDDEKKFALKLMNVTESTKKAYRNACGTYGWRLIMRGAKQTIDFEN